MRRIVLWAMSTLTVLVLLFSYHTSTSSTVVATAETRSGSSTTRSGSSSSSSSSSSGTSNSGNTSGTSGSSGSGSSGSGSSSKTVAGDEVMTRYGVVQVQITVAGGKITAADALQVPDQDRRDQMINSQAVPVYNTETVDAQSAQIDVVSGATYTWEGYTQSLQSAIDKANL